MAKDNENNTWVITGSFDKTAKIWTVDLDLVHRLDNFMATVSGICYVPRNKTLWVAGGTSYATLFDPKSGDKVSKKSHKIKFLIFYYLRKIYFFVLSIFVIFIKYLINKE